MPRSIEDITEEYHSQLKITRYNLEQTRLKLRDAEQENEGLKKTVAYQQQIIDKLEKNHYAKEGNMILNESQITALKTAMQKEER